MGSNGYLFHARFHQSTKRGLKCERIYTIGNSNKPAFSSRAAGLYFH